MDHASDVRSRSHSGGPIRPADIIHILRTHVRWWTIPALVCTVLAVGYSLVAPRHWRATQALIIRPEAASISDEHRGKFSDLSEMKTLQETILELAKSQSVIQATLAAVGPPKSCRNPQAWPTPIDVEDFRELVDMRPPGGAEFGKTEVFYLSIRDTQRSRASALVASLCRELEMRMQELRNERAQGMIDELERTVAMADEDLSTQNRSLTTFESRVGSDLAELRNLNADVGGQSEVSQHLQAIESERRTNEARHQENKRLRELLLAAERDPQQLLATPNSLLVSQPSVSQLKNALVNAQIQTANLLGSRAERHPFVVAARESEELIRERLNKEVAVAIRGLAVDIKLCEERETALVAKATAARSRLANLARWRADYARLVSSVANQTRLVEAARKNLADARARRAAAFTSSVISRIDGVEAGIRPVGPGRKAVAAGGCVGGLLLGLGFVFLFAPLQGTRNSTFSSVNGVVPPANVAKPTASREPSTAPVLNERTLNETKAATRNFGLFRGMTLDEAIRSVERQVSHRGAK